MLSQFVVVPTQHTRSHYDIMDTTLRRLKNVRRESTHDKPPNKIHIPYYEARFHKLLRGRKRNDNNKKKSGKDKVLACILTP